MANITFTEASGLNDSIFGKSQAPIRMFIEKKGEAFEAQSMIPSLFLTTTSEHYGEKLTSLTAFEGFKAVGENGAYPSDATQEGYSKFLESVTWKNSFTLSREIVEDSSVIDLRRRPAAFVTSYYRTRERFAASLYGAALSGKSSIEFAGATFDTTCADGKTLFATDHMGKVSGKAQSNCFSDPFSVTALAKLESVMQNLKGDNDELLDITPDTILIPNSYELKKAVFEAIGADCDPASANNGYNYQFGRWNVIIWPYLNNCITEGEMPWMLLDSTYNTECGGAVWIDRAKLDVRSVIDNTNDANIWQGYSRFTAGFNDWHFAAVGGMSEGDTL